MPCMEKRPQQEMPTNGDMNAATESGHDFHAEAQVAPEPDEVEKKEQYENAACRKEGDTDPQEGDVDIGTCGKLVESPRHARKQEDEEDEARAENEPQQDGTGREEE